VAFRERDRSWLHLLAVGCLYAAVGLFVQRELVRAGLARHVYQQNMLGQDCLLHAWTIAWDQHALATAPCGVGEANVFHPEHGTLFYSDHLLGLALLAAPLRLATDDALLVHNLLLVTAPVLDALALYALARYLTGSTAAAIVGGLAYGFAPLRFLADACQIQMTAAWWLPLLLLGGLRAVRGDGVRWALLAGAALLGQGLTGIYLTAFFLPFLALAHLVWWRRYGVTRGFVAWLAAEAAAVALLVPTGLAYQAVQRHLGAARSPFVNAILSLNWAMIADHVAWRTLLVLAVLVVLRPSDLPRRLREERALFVVIAAGALLLGLGPALPLPLGLGTIPGPYRALVELPGFTALRVPARMLHVGLVGASVLAAGGVVVLRELLWRAPLAATLAVVAALAGELPPRTGGLLPVPHPARMSPVYPWLARQPRTGAVVELPHDPYGLSTAVRQFASTHHWQPMLQGMSGVLPPMYPWVSGRLARFPAPDVVADLRALGVTRVVVHTSFLGAEVRAAIADAERARRVLKRRWARGPTIVYALRPAAPRVAAASGRPVPRTAWRATASVAPDLAPRAIDDDPATAWQSWGDLDASVQRAWYHPLSVLERWQVFLATSPATLTIDLGTTVPATAVHVHFGGSDPMVLPEARLEASVDEITWTALPLAPFPDVRALVTRAAEAPMAAVLAAPRAVRYLRIAVAAYDGHVQDVAVLAR
jgi:hypothetical protein